MQHLPKIRLHAPWGFAVVMGHLSYIPQPESTKYRGQIRIEQILADNVKSHLSTIKTLCQRNKIELYPKGVTFSDVIKAGFMGTVDITNVLMRNQVFYERHFNLNGLADGHEYIWVCENPKVNPFKFKMDNEVVHVHDNGQVQESLF